ncbi:leucine-rich repeat domain-containing protein [Planctomycetota bacterium]|nr:leucine-rich repeat domain-containing protein [Planctomycetota bacterium]
MLSKYKQPLSITLFTFACLTTNLNAADLDSDGLLDLNEIENFASYTDDAFVHFNNIGLEDLDGANQLTATDIRIFYNNIDTVKTGTFVNMNTAYDVDLRYNNIRKVEANSFQNLPDINKIDLGYNEIEILNANAFKGLTNLRDLRLGYNKFSTIAPGIFSDLDKLWHLDLVDTQLSTIAANDFQNLTKLDNMRLNYNQISHIDTHAFDNLSELTELLMRNNDLNTLQNGLFDGLSKVKHLDVGYNDLETLGKDVFQSFTQIEELELGYNFLGNSFEDGTFRTLGTAWRIDIRYNNITNLNMTDAALDSIESFKVAGNPIESANFTRASFTQNSFYHTLNGTTNLDTLRNIILDEVDFENATDLNELLIANHVETLSIQNATNLQLTNIDLVFDDQYMQNLHTLNLTGSWNDLTQPQQSNLLAWDDIEGNTLIIPEPTTALLTLSLITFITTPRRKRHAVA